MFTKNHELWYDYSIQQFIPRQKQIDNMSRVEKTLAHILLTCSKQTGVDWQEVDELSKVYYGKRRSHRPYIKFRTCSWNWNEHGTFEHMGLKYDYQLYEDTVVVSYSR